MYVPLVRTNQLMLCALPGTRTYVLPVPVPLLVQVVAVVYEYPWLTVKLPATRTQITGVRVPVHVW